MIFPIPLRPKGFDLTPVTWTLVILNVLLFVLVFSFKNESAIEESFLKESSIQLTGLVYLKTKNPQTTLSHLGPEDLQMMGIQALKDRPFLENLENLPPMGDQLQFESWKKSAIEFRNYFFSQSSSTFGLNHLNKNSLSWITYQFSHASWIHLLSNMAYLIILGTVVESQVGGLALLLIYLCGGIAGGLFFIALSSHGLAPVIGASGSVSALLGFYSIYESRKRIKYFFFLTPLKNHFGFIFLPALWIIPLYLLTDWVSYLSSPPEWGGSVAYTAHLGGSFFGILLAVTMRFIFKISPATVFDADPP